MNRDVWEKIVDFVDINQYPQLTCPYCLKQSLVINKNEIQYKKALVKAHQL